MEEFILPAKDCKTPAGNVTAFPALFFLQAFSFSGVVN
jgi:hypothetical protein